MAEKYEVINFVEVPRLNRTSGEVENYYRYRVRTARGNIFSEMVPENVARSEQLDELLARKATELDHAIKG